ncbi:MAG: nucleotidyltransferase family protein [Acidobacteriota bacterium]
MKVFYRPYSQSELLALIRAGLLALKERLPLKRVVLFGSYAKDRQTAGSDIDLLVIYSGPPLPDAFSIVKRTLKVPRLEPHVYSEEEYEQVRPTVERMIDDAIPLEVD